MSARGSGARHAFEFVDDVTSDLSFRARGESLEGLFAAAAEAILAATVAEPDAVEARVRLPIRLAEADLELLLLCFLDELVYRRDAEGLLLRAGPLRVMQDGGARLEGELVGEPVDRERHRLQTEVKAVTAHGLRVARVGDTWEAAVTVDV